MQEPLEIIPCAAITTGARLKKMPEKLHRHLFFGYVAFIVLFLFLSYAFNFGAAGVVVRLLIVLFGIFLRTTKARVPKALVYCEYRFYPDYLEIYRDFADVENDNSGLGIKRSINRTYYRDVTEIKYFGLPAVGKVYNVAIVTYTDEKTRLPEMVEEVGYQYNRILGVGEPDYKRKTEVTGTLIDPTVNDPMLDKNLQRAFFQYMGKPVVMSGTRANEN